MDFMPIRDILFVPISKARVRKTTSALFAFISIQTVQFKPVGGEEAAGRVMVGTQRSQSGPLLN